MIPGRAGGAGIGSFTNPNTKPTMAPDNRASNICSILLSPNSFYKIESNYIFLNFCTCSEIATSVGNLSILEAPKKPDTPSVLLKT